VNIKAANKANQSDGFSVTCFVVYATLPQNNPLQSRSCLRRYIYWAVGHINYLSFFYPYYFVHRALDHQSNFSNQNLVDITYKFALTLFIYV